MITIELTGDGTAAINIGNVKSIFPIEGLAPNLIQGLNMLAGGFVMRPPQVDTKLKAVDETMTHIGPRAQKQLIFDNLVRELDQVCKNYNVRLTPSLSGAASAVAIEAGVHANAGFGLSVRNDL